MKVSGSSPFIKWCYLLRLSSLKADVEPQETSVCELFARAFLGTPLGLLLVAFILVTCGPIYLLSKVWERYMWRIDWDREIRFPVSVRVIGQRITDWRERVCTKVEIE